MIASSPIEGRIRVSGWLIAAGLLVQLVSLIWTHPLAFMVFLLIIAVHHMKEEFH